MLSLGDGLLTRWPFGSAVALLALAAISWRVRGVRASFGHYGNSPSVTFAKVGEMAKFTFRVGNKLTIAVRCAAKLVRPLFVPSRREV